MPKIILIILLLSLSLFGIGQQKINTDVLVIGGSTGGTAAGIQCARLGVKTIIIEPTSWLGGMLSAAGVSCTDGNDEMPGGIWQEFREALYKHYHTRNLFTGWVSETCFEPHVADSIFKAWALKEKSLTVLNGWYFDHIIKQEGKVAGAVFINSKNETLSVSAITTIDATDLGDVFENAGEEYDLGMEDKYYSLESMAPGKNDMIQDLTWVAILKDYSDGTDHTIKRPPGYDSVKYFCSCTDAPCINGKSYNADAKKMLDYARLPNNKYMINWPAHGNDWYENITSSKQIDRYKVLEDARNNTLGFIYFIQTTLGFKNLGLSDEFPSNDKLALMPYHREGRRVRGIVRMNANHLTDPFNQKDKLYRTGIAVGDYPVDHHHSTDKKPPSINFPHVPSFNIAMGALIPKSIEGLIVCEKGISVSNIVNGSTRLQPCVLLTGQAAGIIAAKSVLEKKKPRQIEVRAVQKELLKTKAYIMPYFDIRPTDDYWESVQRIGATGILKGTGKPEGWANKTFFYPDSTISEIEFAQGLHDFENSFPLNKYKSKAAITVKQAWNMAVEMQHYLRLKLKIPHKYPSIIMDEWKATIKANPHLGISSGDQFITRKQLAVMLDDLAQNPFDQKIDFYGHRK